MIREKEKKRRGNAFVLAALAGVISSVVTLTLAPYSQHMKAEFEEKLVTLSKEINLSQHLTKLEGR